MAGLGPASRRLVQVGGALGISVLAAVAAARADALGAGPDALAGGFRLAFAIAAGLALAALAVTALVLRPAVTAAA